MTDYATLLKDRVTLSVRCIDRILMQGYVEKLQMGGGAASYLLRQRRLPFPSSAAYKHIADKYAADVQLWAAHGIPVHHFEKGENKELYARPLIQAAAQQGGDGRVVLLGIAQEKASVWRSWRDKSYRGPGNRPQMAWGRQAAFINHFYFRSCWGSGLGTCFLEDQCVCAIPHLDISQRT